MAHHDTAHRRSLLDERCARHQFEAAVDRCRQCGHAFCGECLVYSFGPEAAAVLHRVRAVGRRASASNAARPRAAEAGAAGAARRREASVAEEAEAERTADDDADRLEPPDRRDRRRRRPRLPALRGRRPDRRPTAPAPPPPAPTPEAGCSAAREQGRPARAGDPRRGRLRPSALSRSAASASASAVVGDGQHLHHQQRRVHRAVDGHGGHRDALGHLHRGVEGVDAVERAARQRHADHRQRGVGGDDAGQVGGHAGAADEGDVARPPGPTRRARRPGPGCGGPTAPARRPRCRSARACRPRAAILSRSLGEPIRTATFTSVPSVCGVGCGGRGDVGAVVHAGPADLRRRRRRPGPGPTARSGPWPVTASTRPPAVTRRPVAVRRPTPAQKTVTPVDGRGRVEALDDVAGARRRAGSPRPRSTTVTAASSPKVGRRRERAGGRRGEQLAEVARSSRGSTTWVSGSPKRTLYSSILGPSGVSISPA